MVSEQYKLSCALSVHEAKCSEGQSPCTGSSGTCMYGSCICSPGFAATDVGCVACTSGTYKPLAGGSPGLPMDCSNCPDTLMVTDTFGTASVISGATRVQHCRCPYGSWRSASILSYSLRIPFWCRRTGAYLSLSARRPCCYAMSARFRPHVVEMVSQVTILTL